MQELFQILAPLYASLSVMSSHSDSGVCLEQDQCKWDANRRPERTCLVEFACFCLLPDAENMLEMKDMWNRATPLPPNWPWSFWQKLSCTSHAS